MLLFLTFLHGLLAQTCPSLNTTSGNSTSNGTTSSSVSTIQAASAAWVYGLPALLIARTRDYYTSAGVPINYVTSVRTLTTAAQRTIVKPNADTLYSIAFFDLSQGPVTLHIPNITDRYFVAALYDAYTNNFANPGSFEQSPAGNYYLYGPDYALCANSTPADFNVISPTNDVVMIARFYVLNATVGSDDYSIVNAEQDELYVANTPATILSLSPSFSNKTNSVFASYFALNEAVGDNPVQAAAYDSNYSSTGLFAGRSFRPTLSVTNLTSAQSSGNASIAGVVGTPGFLKTLGNGWILPLQIGTYGDNYRARAYIANTGLFALTSDQAIYPTYIGGAVSAANGTQYTVFFPDGEPPTANTGFWSLTLYDSDGFFVENALNRYSLGSRDASTFEKSANGSFSIVVSTTEPSSGSANWLPAPNGVFVPTLRVYLTTNANWTYPIISKS